MGIKTKFVLQGNQIIAYQGIPRRVLRLQTWQKHAVPRTLCVLPTGSQLLCFSASVPHMPHSSFALPALCLPRFPPWKSAVVLCAWPTTNTKSQGLCAYPWPLVLLSGKFHKPGKTQGAIQGENKNSGEMLQTKMDIMRGARTGRICHCNSQPVFHQLNSRETPKGTRLPPTFQLLVSC